MSNTAIPIVVDAASVDRFSAFIVPEPTSGCWLWLGTIAKNGYAKFGAGVLNDHRMVLGHRFAFTAFRGAIRVGMELDHLCAVRCCVNPNHLQEVTHQANIWRSTAPAGLKYRRTTCPKGHPYDMRDSKGRRCSICRTEQRKRAAQ